MNATVHAWVKDKVHQHNLAARTTLECGSLNVNGTVRDLFTGPYTGIDQRPGPGVDLIASAASMPFDDGHFDTVVTTEMLEHDPTFWLSLREIHRVLAKRGWLLLTARGIGFPLHDHPADYWRFTPTAVRHLFTHFGFEPVEITDDPHEPGVFGLARKP